MKSHYVMRLALNSQYRILPLLAEFIGICHNFQTICWFSCFYECLCVKYACMYVCLHVWACGCMCVGAHVHEVDIWYLSRSCSTLHADQGCSLDLNSLTKLVQPSSLILPSKNWGYSEAPAYAWRLHECGGSKLWSSILCSKLCTHQDSSPGPSLVVLEKPSRFNFTRRVLGS